ncbi:ABC transporter permease [Nannocystis pusilla]|uniref:ABC transporter permease n=1 Tax=Nannocystis pusilla TaxID=889268 RepID=UPI003DA67C48
MLDVDRWQEIWGTLRRNRLRAVLTACGVFWGVFMLIVMLGFGHGLSEGVRRGMAGFASNSMYVWPQRTLMPHDGLAPGRFVRLTLDDAAAVRAGVRGIRVVAPRNELGGGRRGAANVRRGGKTGSFRVAGEIAEIELIQPVVLERGRFLNPLDLAERRKVVVIGAAAREQLFAPGEDPIGASIEIRGAYFMVVGVFRSPQTGDEAERHNTTLFVPLTTYARVFGTGEQVGNFAILAQDGVQSSRVEADVLALLGRRHHVHPADRQAFGSFNADREMRKVAGLFDAINLVIWFVGVVTLIAGVIGVSNIMLIVVKERTREIGVRKAVGATPASIIAQIVQESTALTAVAGGLGLMFGVTVLELVGTAMDSLPPGKQPSMFSRPEVDITIALAAVGVLVVFGALAGVLPARHAVNINPVEALRAD